MKKVELLYKMHNYWDYWLKKPITIEETAYYLAKEFPETNEAKIKREKEEHDDVFPPNKHILKRIKDCNEKIKRINGMISVRLEREFEDPEGPWRNQINILLEEKEKINKNILNIRYGHKKSI